jgi:4-hydroxy-tetrahydrodipicolinate reductase
LPETSVVTAIESNQCAFLGKDAGIVAGTMDIGVLISDDPRKGPDGADVWIDFSFPSSSVKHALLAVEMKKPVVVGTTGLSKEEQDSLKKAALKTAVLCSPNMSLGVNIMNAVIGEIAGKLRNYEIEIVETHHSRKKDAPSGTALRLAETIASARGISLDNAAVYGRKGNSDERQLGQIGIHAVRAGDTVGEHTVIFATEGERIEMTHRASSRDCFALGALHAAQWLVSRKPGLYDMGDVLGLKQEKLQ